MQRSVGRSACGQIASFQKHVAAFQVGFSFPENHWGVDSQWPVFRQTLIHRFSMFSQFASISGTRKDSNDPSFRRYYAHTGAQINKSLTIQCKTNMCILPSPVLLLTVWVTFRSRPVTLVSFWIKVTKPPLMGVRLLMVTSWLHLNVTPSTNTLPNWPKHAKSAESLWTSPKNARLGQHIIHYVIFILHCCKS